MELSLSQKQALTLSPQMIQTMEILQMDSQELLEYIGEVIQENPLLEQVESTAKQEEYFKLKRELAWLDSCDTSNRFYHLQDMEENDDPLRNCGVVNDEEETLCEHLLSQLEAIELPFTIKRAAIFIAKNLNTNGWLDEDLFAIANAVGCSEKIAERALSVVQSLDPPGVACRNLSECLCIQLVRKCPEQDLALRIAQSHLDLLAKSHYRLIAQKLESSLVSVRQACDFIRSLNPRPGAGYSSGNVSTYINPDILVFSDLGKFEVVANDYFFPSLQISGYYTQLMKDEQGDVELRSYLTNKVRQAKWVIGAIEQRRTTLLSCARCIVEAQQGFFWRGSGYLAPLTLARVANQLGVHESTVSRAIRGKFLQCDKGTYPLNYFFSRGLAMSYETEQEVSSDQAKALLKRLVAEEDRSKPLSDQKLCELMTQEGCELSRRTVAKYRSELNIPSTVERRQYK